MVSSPPMPMSRRIPDNNFDFLRAFLAVMVIFSHSFPLLYGSHDQEPLAAWSRGQWSIGDLAVNFFFIISGLLITHSWLNSKSATDFFRKRALRIYPGFVAAMGVCDKVVLPLASPDGLPGDIREWARVGVRTVLLQKFLDWSAFSFKPMPHVVNGRPGRLV